MIAESRPYCTKRQREIEAGVTVALSSIHARICSIGELSSNHCNTSLYIYYVDLGSLSRSRTDRSESTPRGAAYRNPAAATMDTLTAGLEPSNQ